MKLLTKFKIVFLMQLVTIMIAVPVLASDGGLTGQMIEKIRSSFEMDTHTRAMYNAITNNDIAGLALNRDIVRRHNELFSHKTKTKGITNQKSSGRCWIFAALNMIRPDVIEKYNLESFELSQNYIAFWDKMEKANTFLERMIEFRDRDPFEREMVMVLRVPLPDGGYWENSVDLIKKYGVVPKEIMPETNSSGGTKLMNKVISQKLRADAVKLREMNKKNKTIKQMRAEKEKMMAEVYRMLVMNLGEPPSEFQWRYEDANSLVSEMKTYTPKSFLEDFVKTDVGEYVNIFNDTIRDYGQHCQIRMSRNVYDGQDIHYANVNIETLKNIAMKSILDEAPVMFAADVGYDMSRKTGIMENGLYDFDSVYQIDMKMSKAERALYRNSIRGHGMVFTGVDVQDGKPIKWLVENSWGDEKGSKGYWACYDEWFNIHVYNIIVKKKYVSEEILKIFEKPAKILEPWDPML